MRYQLKWKLFFEFLVTLISMIIMITGFFINLDYYHYVIAIIMFFLASFLVFYLELDYFRVYQQLKNRDFTMDFLIAIAIHITYFYSLISSIIKMSSGGIKTLNMEFWDIGYELAFFIGLGHYLEQKLKLKTSLGIKELLKLQNKKATLIHNDQLVITDVNHLMIGDLVQVANGETIPTDGILVSSEAYLDYASLLGESIPRNVLKEEEILSGSINVGDLLVYRVTKRAQDSALMQIIKQLEKIINQKSKIERTSEKIVKYFLPTILMISLLTLIFWLIIFYQGVVQVEQPIAWAIYRAVAILVIACPCAFGIAAPAAIYSSSFIASKNKILFSSARIYEMIDRVQFVIFDKTGTITNGMPEVKTKQVIEDKDQEIIISLSALSQHPLAKAINSFGLINFEHQKNTSFDYVQEIPGVGIKAQKGHHIYTLTSLKYAQENGYQISSKLQFDQKATTSVFAINQKVKVIFNFYDAIKNDAQVTINQLRQLGYKTVILSGDRYDQVEQIAQQLKIDYWYGDLMPEQKAELINQYKLKGKVIFVGDGINDVLAIKSADVSFSYASGSDLTNSLSDVTLLVNDLNLVLKTIVLAKRTLLLVKINFIWAFLFNFICIPLAFIGFIPPWLGVILMISSTSFLLINTLIFKRRNQIKINKL